MCYQYFTIKKCGCYDVSVPNYESLNKTVCLSETEMNCLFDLYRNYLNENKRDECLLLCPMECVTIEYSVTSTIIDYPSKPYASLITNNKYLRTKFNDFQMINLEKCLLKLNIYFETLDYEIISEIQALNIVSLLSNIGGTIGLFLGGSILSFVEFLEIFLEFLFVLCDYSSSKNKIVNLF